MNLKRKSPKRVVHVVPISEMKTSDGNFKCILCDVEPPFEYPTERKLLAHVMKNHMHGQGTGKIGHPEIYISLVSEIRDIRISSFRITVNKLGNVEDVGIQTLPMRLNKCKKLYRSVLCTFGGRKGVLNSLNNENLTYDENFATMKMNNSYPLVTLFQESQRKVLHKQILVNVCVDNNDKEAKMTFGLNRKEKNSVYHPLTQRTVFFMNINIGQVQVTNFFMGKWKVNKLFPQVQVHVILTRLTQQTIMEERLFDEHLLILINSIIKKKYLEEEPFVSKVHFMKFDFTKAKTALENDKIEDLILEFTKFIEAVNFMVLDVTKERCASAEEFRQAVRSVEKELSNTTKIAFTGSDQPGHIALRTTHPSILVKMHTMKYSLIGTLKLIYEIFGFEKFLEKEFHHKLNLRLVSKTDSKLCFQFFYFVGSWY